MKIRAITTHYVYSGPHRNWTLVKVDTDEGIHGWGEAYSQYDRDTAVMAQLIAWHVLNKVANPADGRIYLRLRQPMFARLASSAHAH